MPYPIHFPNFFFSFSFSSFYTGQLETSILIKHSPLFLSYTATRSLTYFLFSLFLFCISVEAASVVWLPPPRRKPIYSRRWERTAIDGQAPKVSADSNDACGLSALPKPLPSVAIFCGLWRCPTSISGQIDAIWTRRSSKSCPSCRTNRRR